MTIRLNLPDGTDIAANPSHPIILLGPNGVGKTRFAVDLHGRNNPNAERISANRFIGLTDLPRQADQDLKSNATDAMRRQNSEYWNVHNEYTFLMAQILEEDKSSAQKYRAAHLKRETISADLAATRLKKITDLWQSLFPGRTLALDYSPLVSRVGENPYPTGQMSEGERTALYLITRIVSSDKTIIIVDEPEIHFHPLLARQFWNAMEAYKKDALFIYVTHDIPFALSRSKPLLYIVRSPGSFDVINDAQIPDDAINAILGAASFSISASRLIFCEGGLDEADHKLLKAWYNCPKTAVIPVGGCDNVRQCVSVFNGNHATKNVVALGHIDRDDWSDEYLGRLIDITPLPINEIEGVVCYEPIFKALANYHGHNNIDQRYTSFVTAARNSVRGVILNKHALNRGKLILELKQQQMRNSVTANPDVIIMKSAFLSGVTDQAEAAQILDDQINILTAAINTTDLFKMFPAKTYQGGFQGQMGVTTETALELVCKVLTMSDAALAKEDSKAALKTAIIDALSPHLYIRAI